VPTALGITLVRGYQTIDIDLCLPDIRRFIEQQITLIAKGQMDYTRVVQHALQEFSAKFNYFVAQARYFLLLPSFFLFAKSLQLMAMIGRKVLIHILFQADRAHGCPL